MTVHKHGLLHHLSWWYWRLPECDWEHVAHVAHEVWRAADVFFIDERIVLDA